MSWRFPDGSLVTSHVKMDSFDTTIPMQNEILPFKERRQRLIDYLLMKVHESDWHGVSDAANDLRVLEASQLK